MGKLRVQADILGRAFPILLASMIGLTVLHYSSASSSSSVPTKIEQVTNDGLTKTNLLSDGTSLYVSEVRGRDHVVMRVSANNEGRIPIVGAFPGGRALDISHDRSRLLMSPAKGDARNQELWEVPINSGSPRRVGNLVASDASWSSDGEKLALVKDFDLLMASRGGTSVTKLATLNGRPFSPRFSPDGNRIRFTVGDVEHNTSTLWEINADGSGLHELLPEGDRPAGACCGVWTADGGYYVFQARVAGSTSTSALWALPDSRTQGGVVTPFRLTDGPMSFGTPRPSADADQMWALGVKPVGELVKYDARRNKFFPLLSGVSGTDLDFSLDGKWVSYVSIPDGQLWRSRADGSDRLQLTHGSDRAALPRWSPDGKQIAYVSVRSGQPWKILIVPSNGGTPSPIRAEGGSQIDANWSSDGSKMMFGYAHDSAGLAIRILDLKTKVVSTIPGSDGLFSPRWSPNGRYVAALSPDFTKLMVFDFVAQKWSTWLTEPAGAVSYPLWSSNSEYLYFDDSVTDEESIRRVRVGEHLAEKVFVLHGIERYPGPFGLWSGRAPDGSWLFVRDRSSQEVYSLKMELSK